MCGRRVRVDGVKGVKVSSPSATLCKPRHGASPKTILSARSPANSFVLPLMTSWVTRSLPSYQQMSTDLSSDKILRVLHTKIEMNLCLSRSITMVCNSHLCSFLFDFFFSLDVLNIVVSSWVHCRLSGLKHRKIFNYGVVFFFHFFHQKTL